MCQRLFHSLKLFWSALCRHYFILFFFYFLNRTYRTGHYNPSVRIIKLVSHIIILLSELRSSFSHHLCCVRKFLYMSGAIYCLTSTQNDRFLRNFFMAGLFTLRLFAGNLLRGNRRRNIFLFSDFVLMPDLGYETRLYV